MKANRNVFVSGRVDKEAKEWIEKHPLNQSDFINYGPHLIRMMESSLKEQRHLSTQ